MFAKHRSQGGHFHIVQRSKKRKNTNCKYYKDGRRLKRKVVCGEGDICYAFVPGYSKKNTTKTQEHSSYEELDQVKSPNPINISKEKKRRITDGNKSVYAFLLIYRYKTENHKAESFCLLPSIYNRYRIDKVYCIHPNQRSYITKIKNCEDIVFRGVKYTYLHKSSKKVKLVLKPVSKSVKML